MMVLLQIHMKILKQQVYLVKNNGKMTMDLKKIAQAELKLSFYKMMVEMKGNTNVNTFTQMIIGNMTL